MCLLTHVRKMTQCAIFHSRHDAVSHARERFARSPLRFAADIEEKGPTLNESVDANTMIAFAVKGAR